MQSSDIPAYKFTDIWSIDAAGGNVTYPIPDTTATIGRASLQKGFPPETFQPTAAGGVPPFGQDFNGAYRMVTEWERWYQAANVLLPYDGAFSSSIGGYPKGAMLVQAAGPGLVWLSFIENNTVDPDTNPTDGSWGALTLLPMFGTDSGTANAVVVTLSTTFQVISLFNGHPISIRKGAANTGGVTINLNGFGALACLHGDGTALTPGELPGSAFFTCVYDSVSNKFYLQSFNTAPTLPATSTQMESAAATDVYAAPGTVGFHPGTVKAYAFYNAKTQTLGAHRNISSVTYNAVGSYTFNLSGGFNYTAGLPWINALDAVGGPCIGAAHGVLTGVDPSAQVGVFGNGTTDAPSGAFDPTSVLFFVTGEVSN